MPTASGLTSKQLNEMACDYAISIYLREGEIKEEMLKKYNGNKVELVKYLHKREFAQYEKQSGKKTKIEKEIIEKESDIFDPKHDPKEEDIVTTGKKTSSKNKNKKQSKSSDKSNDQKELF